MFVWHFILNFKVKLLTICNSHVLIFVLFIWTNLVINICHLYHHLDFHNSFSKGIPFLWKISNILFHFIFKNIFFFIFTSITFYINWHTNCIIRACSEICRTPFRFINSKCMFWRTHIAKNFLCDSKSPNSVFWQKFTLKNCDFQMTGVYCSELLKYIF